MPEQDGGSVKVFRNMQMSRQRMPMINPIDNYYTFDDCVNFKIWHSYVGRAKEVGTLLHLDILEDMRRLPTGLNASGFCERILNSRPVPYKE